MNEPHEFISLAIAKKGITQKQAATQLEISEQYMSDLVRGRRSVSAYVAVRLQRHLGLNAEMLLLQQIRAELQIAWEEYKGEVGEGSGDAKEVRENPAAVHRKPLISR